MQHAINMVMDTCHEASLDAGWWHNSEGEDLRINPMCFSQKLCLIHSEISEAMEGDRKDCADDKLPHKDMREVELADALIRIFDLCGAYNMDIGSAVVEKIAYNRTRLDHSKESRQSVGGKGY